MIKCNANSKCELCGKGTVEEGSANMMEHIDCYHSESIEVITFEEVFERYGETLRHLDDHSPVKPGSIPSKWEGGCPEFNGCD